MTSDNELLASILMRFFASDGYWFLGNYPNGPHLTIDTEIGLTAYEYERLTRIVGEAKERP